MAQALPELQHTGKALVKPPWLRILVFGDNGCFDPKELVHGKWRSSLHHIMVVRRDQKQVGNSVSQRSNNTISSEALRMILVNG